MCIRDRILSVPAAAIGAAVGGIIGAISGLFAKKKKDVFGGLLEQWPELVKETGKGYKEINVDLAKTLLSTNQLDENTKVLLQNVLSQKDAYNEAQKQMSDVVKELVGNLGNDLRNSLVEAWKAGEDGAKAFGDTVDKVLENVLSNILFHAVFNTAFKELQGKLEKDFLSPTVGSDLTETMGDFFKKNKDNVAKFNEAMRIASEEAEKSGLNAFKQDKTGKNKGTLSGAIAAASQESIDLLAGHTMGMRVSQLKTNDLLVWGFGEGLAVANRSFESLAKIETNTLNTVSELKTLNNKMQSSSDVALAMGGK